MKQNNSLNNLHLREEELLLVNDIQEILFNFPILFFLFIFPEYFHLQIFVKQVFLQQTFFFLEKTIFNYIFNELEFILID